MKYQVKVMEFYVNNTKKEQQFFRLNAVFQTKLQFALCKK